MQGKYEFRHDRDYIHYTSMNHHRLSSCIDATTYEKKAPWSVISTLPAAAVRESRSDQNHPPQKKW